MTTTPESNPKILTLAEANAAVPNIGQLLERLQGLQRALVDGEAQHEELTKKLAREFRGQYTQLT